MNVNKKTATQEELEIDTQIEKFFNLCVDATKLEEKLASEFTHNMLGAKQAQARAKVQIDEFKKNLALQFGRKQIFEPLQKGLLAIVREMRSLAHNDPIRENFTSGLTKVNELDQEGAKMSPAKEGKEQETKVYDSLQELLVHRQI